MQIEKTEIAGLHRVSIQPHRDERGFFARTWCADEFAAHGLCRSFAQSSVAFNAQRGTLRGIHYQRNPHWEEKLVRVTNGAAYVVAVDLRVDSPTHRHWVGCELTFDNRMSIYVPQGCAQGYQTLADDTELLYCMSTPYAPESADGVRFDDPAFGIEWPLEVSAISDRDRQWPNYSH